MSNDLHFKVSFPTRGKKIGLFDSKLVANKLGVFFEAMDERMSSYLDVFHNWAHKFHMISDIQRLWNIIRHTNTLALLFVIVEIDTKIIVEIYLLKNPSIDTPLI